MATIQNRLLPVHARHVVNFSCCINKRVKMSNFLDKILPVVKGDEKHSKVACLGHKPPKLHSSAKAAYFSSDWNSRKAPQLPTVTIVCVRVLSLRIPWADNSNCQLRSSLLGDSQCWTQIPIRGYRLNVNGAAIGVSCVSRQSYEAAICGEVPCSHRHLEPSFSNTVASPSQSSNAIDSREAGCSWIA